MYLLLEVVLPVLDVPWMQSQEVCSGNLQMGHETKYFKILGLKTAVVEADDFASGTSSRSTKLIHGGVRYLQKAIMQFDVEQYHMVKEALNERANMIHQAPHLAYPLPIMLPVYK